MNGAMNGAGESVTRFLQAPGKSLGLDKVQEDLSAKLKRTPNADGTPAKPLHERLNLGFLKGKPSQAEVTRASADAGAMTQTRTQETTARPDGTPSPVIADLQARYSVLPSGSSYAQVAHAVLASSARIEEAELKAAHLRAQAAKYNWLPRLGPSISLTSLGDFVASLVVEQVLYDNGRKKAERDYARHDVEKAAVALSQASNTRVHDALALYLAAEEGRARIAIADRSLKDMGHFEWIMNERVKGGVSDMSDLNIIRQKLAEIRSQREGAAAAVATAEAELAAMAGKRLSGLSGTAPLALNVTSGSSLDVVMAQVESDIAVAQAKIARAQHLPGLSARGTLASNAPGGISVNGGSDQLFGIGTGASLKAIEAAKDTAGRKVTQAREDEARKLAALDSQARGLQGQLGEAKSLVRQSKNNLDLFQAQYKGGARQVMDVVGVYETWARQSEAVVTKTYQLEKLRIKKAKELGLLADGGMI